MIMTSVLVEKVEKEVGQIMGWESWEASDSGCVVDQSYTDL